MELRHLRYFVAVGEEQHYGRAAERLGIAQPALSRQIQDLEKELGFTLFDRLPRGVKISAAGKCFMEDARRILHEVNEAAARAKRVASGQSGTLRVGFVESISWHGVVPDSFRQFRERQPNAELQLKPLKNFEKQLTGVEWMNSFPENTPAEKREKKIYANNCSGRISSNGESSSTVGETVKI